MEELEPYRREIDALDDEIISLLGRRFEIVRSVGALKTRTNLVIVQTRRVEEVLERVSVLAQENGLDPDFVRGLYEAMIDHAHVLENGIKDEHGGT